VLLGIKNLYLIYIREKVIAAADTCRNQKLTLAVLSDSSMQTRSTYYNKLGTSLVKEINKLRTDVPLANEDKHCGLLLFVDSVAHNAVENERHLHRL